MMVLESLRAATPDFDQLVKAVSEERTIAFVKKKTVALAKYKLDRDKNGKWFDQITATASYN